MLLISMLYEDRELREVPVQEFLVELERVEFDGLHGRHSHHVGGVSAKQALYAFRAVYVF